MISGVEFERFAVDPRLAVRPLPMFTVTKVVKKARRRSLVGGPFAADDRRKEMWKRDSLLSSSTKPLGHVRMSTRERMEAEKEGRERERGEKMEGWLSI